MDVLCSKCPVYALLYETKQICKLQYHNAVCANHLRHWIISILWDEHQEIGYCIEAPGHLASTYAPSPASIRCVELACQTVEPTLLSEARALTSLTHMELDQIKKWRLLMASVRLRQASLLNFDEDGASSIFRARNSNQEASKDLGRWRATRKL